ncbi:hypothetical protein BpHYR1_037711 [Brachionus plicatilis]|uniref:Coiled-coil domain-containing protein 43 n=1 Tax=Brachionus plicatilis TaxID=10195 RepID=A0A3M7SBU8_BRAPC|nr:hypothetical protein BpHYR1_037711 [Brachionus plicatilis]
MASSISETEQDELSKQFETWFVERIKGADQNVDTGIFINYILTTLSTDDTSDEEKSEAILPFLQELNQKEISDEENFLKEVMFTWNQMRADFEKRSQPKDSLDNQENTESKVEKGLFVNKNSEDALSREKMKRDKLAENAKKQKEQTKKALVEQRQKEEERKKKAQQKAAKI